MAILLSSLGSLDARDWSDIRDEVVVGVGDADSTLDSYALFIAALSSR